MLTRHYTSDPEFEENFRKDLIFPQTPFEKPHGIWLCPEELGDSWRRFVRSAFQRETTGYRFSVDMTDLLIIDSSESIERLHSDFGVNLFEITADMPDVIAGLARGVDWVGVASVYKGVAFLNYRRSLAPESPWYGSVDLDSLCVWDMDAVAWLGRLS